MESFNFNLRIKAMKFEKLEQFKYKFCLKN